MRKKTSKKVPERALERIVRYLKFMDEEIQKGKLYVTSYELGEKFGVEPALVRKDLSYFGTMGITGVGYKIPHIKKQFDLIFKLNHKKKCIWIGAEKLKHEPELIEEFKHHNCIITAVVDRNPYYVGKTIGDLKVYRFDYLKKIIKQNGIEAAIISCECCEESKVQETANIIVGAGIKSILNYTNTYIKVPSNVKIKNINVVSEFISTLL